MANSKRKIKIFNLIIFIIVIVLVLYLLISLVMLLPVFEKRYGYSIKANNYNIVITTTFKKSLFTCKIKEKYIVTADDKIYSNIKQDFKNVGFKGNKNKFVKTTREFGFCKKKINSYKKIHNNNYVKYKLNGSGDIKLNYGEDYEEKYVTAMVGNKNAKNIEVNSNFNKNVVGNYIISYKLKVTGSYYRFLYRTVKVIDEEKPIITLTGDETVTLEYGNKYDELGYVATDNYDGNISNKVKVSGTINEKKTGTYKLKYTVKDSSNNTTTVVRKVVVEGGMSVMKEAKTTTKTTNKKKKTKGKTTTTRKIEAKETVENTAPNIEIKDGITYVNGIILVNKKYGLPEDYNPGVNSEAYNALQKMQADAKVLNLDLSLKSGYRSYSRQTELYNSYLEKESEEIVNTFSAKPGHSEHQTGLAFDIGEVDEAFANTDEAKWLDQNCHLYGFIIRYPKDKTDVTGYIYEPWHVRYLGVDLATKVKASGLALEEYLGVNQLISR